MAECEFFLSLLLLQSLNSVCACVRMYVCVCVLLCSLLCTEIFFNVFIAYFQTLVAY